MIDLNSLPLYEDRLGSLCGSRSNIAAPKYKAFFEILYNMNVKMYFIREFRLIYNNGNKRLLYMRRDSKQSIAEKVDKGYFLNDIKDEITMTYFLKYNMYLEAKKYGELISITEDDNLSDFILSLIDSIEPMAVISDKTKCLFSNRNVKFWLSMSINFGAMSIGSFDFKKLLQKFNVNEMQMQLCSIIYNSYQGEYENLINDFKSKYHIYNIDLWCSFLHKNNVDVTCNNSLNYLLKLIFGKSYVYDMNDYFVNYLKTLKWSSKPLEFFINKDPIFEKSTMAYLFLQGTFTVSCNFYDHSRYKLKFVDMLSEMHSKLCGFVTLSAGVDTKFTVRYNNQSLVEMIMFHEREVNLKIPDFDVPPLIEMLDQKQYRKFDYIRSKVFLWIINNIISIDEFNVTEKEYLTPLVCLKFLRSVSEFLVLINLYSLTLNAKIFKILYNFNFFYSNWLIYNMSIFVI